MKKKGIINSDLSKIIAGMGHSDKLVVCDAGLPIPRGAEIIDLALTINIPRFLDTLKIIVDELEVEQVILTEELKVQNSGFFENILGLIPDAKIKLVTHNNFKKLTNGNGNISFVRTGEATPFANAILVSGVIF